MVVHIIIPMHYLYATFIYDPLYNGLIFLAHSLPFLDMGLLVILFTVLVKLILFPLSKKAVRTQAMMKLIEPELASIKEKYKDDKQAQALHTMNFYKEKKINPFSSMFLLLVQLPIIWALYRIFYSGGLVDIHTDLLYSFIQAPQALNPLFLGFLDVTHKSVVLAALAAISQFFQISLSAPKPPAASDKGGFQENFARSMHVQMKYVFPVMIFLIGYNLAGALALYWTTSNLFMIGQELVIRRQLKKEGSKEVKA